MRKLLVFLLFGAFCVSVFVFGGKVLAQNETSVFFAPAAGSFAVGSTFDVTIALNTGGRAVNAFKIKVLFPPDKLQIASSGVGSSITGFWVNRPSFSNLNGTIELEGGIPSPGINTDYGIIATLTFRVKSTGQAILRFDSDSAVFLNDGKGTNANALFRNSVYNLILPPPAGPIVVSSTHPDQDRWHPVNDLVLNWASPFPVEGYSYILNDDPVDIPDNISEGLKIGAVYKGLSDGVHYFHIKASRNGVWGGVSHFGVKIQTSGPADFKIDVSPGKRTSSKDAILSFETSDQISGIDHYEIKVISLSPSVQSQVDSSFSPLFFEVNSPYILKLPNYSSYDVILRAFNKAGNYTESSVRLKIIKPIFEWVNSTGLKIAGIATVPWFILWPVAAAILISLLYLAYHIFRWHIRIDLKHKDGALHDSGVSGKLEELKNRFRVLTKVLVFFWISASALFLLQAAPARAEPVENKTATPSGIQQLSPPVTNLLPKDISNEELFYVGGRAVSGNTGRVIIYLQSLTSENTFSFEAGVGANGDWFYSHDKFLPSGNYLIWTQLKVGDQVSPPSSQMQITVSPVAIQLGASRLSYEAIYLILLFVFFAIIIGLGTFIIYHFRQGSRKSGLLMKEIREAEESIKRGFAVLKRDIQAELEAIKRGGGELTEEEKMKETQLLKDLEEINRTIGKEVWDIEKAMGHSAR